MNRILAIALVVLFLIVVGIFIVPMWISSLGMMTPIGWGAFIIAIIFSFAVAGALMFLVFYSARHGYDEGAQMHGEGRDKDPG